MLQCGVYWTFKYVCIVYVLLVCFRLSSTFVLCCTVSLFSSFNYVCIMYVL